MIIVALFLGFKNVNAQDWTMDQISVYDQYDDLALSLKTSSDTLHVINYWATWCKPCVAELPYLEALLNDDSIKNLKMTLVSLDFEHQIETKLLSFLNEHSIKSNVVVLTDGNSNAYINKVDKMWEGSIPATIFKRGEKRLFFEKSFHSVAELKDIINSIN